MAHRFTGDRIICSNMFEHPTELVLAQKRVVDHTLLQESFPRRVKLVLEACTIPICVKVDLRRWTQCPSALINQKKQKKGKHVDEPTEPIHAPDEPIRGPPPLPLAGSTRRQSRSLHLSTRRQIRAPAARSQHLLTRSELPPPDPMPSRRK